ncbi:extracellular solute-binding protein [Alkalibaculum sp. M08DMB]|uniref:Extracellular solute-binding protein n=1 Tax=Alkalibaculum sporogenes TaxID=2655001 RepID=A0A6A7KAK0_9FIRM|nr:ABC transporter substrate-binding protein [Alkalibaculum sporogenes]MPW26375.1 extracellular solute-binding protein [Alkalibaculum sporogenes]
MFKKILKSFCYGIILVYVLSAPFYLNNVYTKKYLTDTSKVEWSGVINMWDIPRLTINGSEFAWIKSRISAYQEVNPNIHISLRELHYNDNKDIAFKAALSNNYPDIMPLTIDNETLPLDHVIPINFLDEEDSIISIKDELIGTVYKDEKIWGIPVYYSVNVLIINKDIFDSLGVKVPEDLNFEEFISLLKSINEKDIKNEIIPYDFYLGDDSYSYMPFLLSDGGNIFSNDNTKSIDFYNQDVLTGLQKLNTIHKQINNLPDNYGLRPKAQVVNDFLNKKTAILAGNLTDINSLLRKSNQGEGFEFIIMPYPKGKTDMPVFFAENVGSYAIMDTGNEEKNQAIYDFMKFLLNEESQNSIESIGRLPVVEGYSYDFETYPHLKTIDDSNFLHIMPFYLDRKLIHNSIEDELKNMFIKNQSTTETLYNIQQSANQTVDNKK